MAHDPQQEQGKIPWDCLATHTDEIPSTNLCHLAVLSYRTLRKVPPCPEMLLIFGAREAMAYTQHVLKILSYFNPPYDPPDKLLRLSDPAREFYIEKCFKLLNVLLHKLSPLSAHTLFQQCRSF